MNSELLGLALAAGMVAAFNPCGFAMLPAYLTLVVRREDGGQLSALGRALAATAAMALGVLTVFATFGLLTVSVASAIARHLPYMTLAVGFSLVALGVWLLTGRELRIGIAGSGARWAPSARLGSMFGYGLGYAIASLSCTIGPFLAVTGSGVRSGSVLSAFGVYAAYTGGFVLVVGVLAVAVAMAGTTLINRLRGVLPYVNRVSGLVMAAVGIYVAYYGWFELRLLGGQGDAADPVMAAAGRIQRGLAGWVYRHGVWPWLAVLAGLAGAALWARWGRRRAARTESAPVASAP